MEGSWVYCKKCQRTVPALCDHAHLSYSLGCTYEGTKYEGTYVMPDRDPLLQEREKMHGSFKDNAQLWEKLCKTGDFKTLTVEQKLALSMIYLKIARIAQNPLEPDHWKDIAGYAKLGEEACYS